MHGAVLPALSKCHHAVHVQQGSGLSRVQGGCCLHVTALCQDSLHCCFGQSLMRKVPSFSVNSPLVTSTSQYKQSLTGMDLCRICLTAEFSKPQHATAIHPQ